MPDYGKDFYLKREVLSSSAVPFQGGVGHLNEQWPQYWRSIFRKDSIKSLIVPEVALVK
jgi:hypothetical protein